MLFTGSVPGEKRGALVERFHADPQCRLFLSTDAGGVGLNLQHAAAVVVNMDLPWNPAVLEQRVGRVHRMGQSRGVQVVNFVGQGSIEEGMLSLLAFKRSLFEGVLDGGEREIFLQGTRLAQFMKSVEQVAAATSAAEVEADGDSAAEPTAAAGAAPPLPTPAARPETAVDSLACLANDAVGPAAELGTGIDAESEVAADAAGLAAAARLEGAAEPDDAGTEIGSGSGPEAAAAASAAPPAGPARSADSWAALLEAGALLLQGLASAQATPGAAPISIERDPVTGQASVRLPLPEPAVLQRLAKAFEPWLQR